MLKVYESQDEKLVELENIGVKGSWICLINPTQEEKEKVSLETGVPLDFLEYPLDEEESSRIEFGEKEILIIIKIPVVRGEAYDTVPLGIIITEDLVITVCLENNMITEELGLSRVKGFYTFKKTRFLLHILYHTSTLYLRYLRQIDKKSEVIRLKLQRSTRNEELIQLLDLGKSLVYFTTSLRSNEIVMEKLLKSYLLKEPDLEKQASLIKMYEEDKELLEEVITENKQAIEMGDIYTSILNSTMDAFASVISNNLNIVMKFLTAVTIVLMIPTAVASFYGMNVSLPGQHSPHAFGGILAVSALLSLITVMIFRKKHMF
ncbi:MAG: magnesium transporter [Clostridia bacterium]|nr:magnesium transporter [Clostridia bacterium]